MIDVVDQFPAVLDDGLDPIGLAERDPAPWSVVAVGQVEQILPVQRWG